MKSNRLREIIKQIQFKEDLTIEQIAKKAGYTRTHLTKELKKDSSPKVEKALLDVFKETIQNVENTSKHSTQNDNSNGTKNPTEEAGLMKELLESQRARIKLLEERQQAETRLIQSRAPSQNLQLSNQCFTSCFFILRTLLRTMPD